MEKARNWTVIAYPEHFETFNEMRDKIESLHVPTVISPVHGADDDDIKPHYHIMFCFAGDKKQYSGCRYVRSF